MRISTPPRQRRAGLLAGLGTLLLLLPPAAARAASDGTAQPNRMPFGTVHVHSTVQANARFTFKEPSGRLQVDIPDFVTVREVRPLKPSDTPDGTPGYDVFFELKTDRPGERSGTLEVRLGDQAAKMPVTASVRPNQPGLTRVLVTSSPFDRYASADAAVYQPILELAKSGTLDLNYFDPVAGQSVLPEAEKLSTYFDVVLLVETGLLAARDEDVTRLRRFVDDGGRLVVAGNHFFQGTVAKANEILKPYGMRIVDTEPRVSLGLPGRPGLAQRSTLVELVEQEDEPLTAGIRKLRFFRPSPVLVTDKDRAKVLVDTPYYLDDGFVGVWRGKGEVVALGQSLWWNWIGGEEGKGVDNARLMQNLLTREKKK